MRPSGKSVYYSKTVPVIVDHRQDDQVQTFVTEALVRDIDVAWLDASVATYFGTLHLS